jgi:hypothetical protein
MGKAGVAALLLLLLAAMPAMARQPSDEKQDAAKSDPLPVGEAVRNAGHIATQPVRDVGIAKAEIEPVLAIAVANPYSLQGLKRCADLGAAIVALNDVLGPDFTGGFPKKENRVGRLAAAGGKTVVNSILPFRGLVREVSGAAPAERRKSAAIDVGYARRGFLRGVYETRRCKPAIDTSPN